jgi:hypothetical protein
MEEFDQGDAMKAKIMLVASFAFSILGIATSNASAQEYAIEWFNNMNYNVTLHNSAGYCTDLTVQLVNNPWGDKKIYTTKTYNGKLAVQTSYTMNLSTSPLSGKCLSMTLSGTCTFNKYGTTNGTPVTEPIKIVETGCSSGRAVFLINAFQLYFSKQ